MKSIHGFEDHGNQDRRDQAYERDQRQTQAIR